MLRFYRLYEALALYDAYYESMANLGSKGEHLGDALPIAWVPLVFHCTYFKHLSSILRDGVVRPGKNKTYVALTELPIPELTRFRSLRHEPFDIAIGFPRALLESKGLFQPAYLKHASSEVKAAFENHPKGYVELNDDLGALHEVRVPGTIPIDEAVWVLSAKRKAKTSVLDLPKLRPIREKGIAISFWHPSHQEGLIKEPVFRKLTRDEKGCVVNAECCGKHYLPNMMNYVDKRIRPPAGNSFKLRFQKETRPDTLRDGWEGPFSKIEMAEFFYQELKKQFPSKIDLIRPRIKI